MKYQADDGSVFTSEHLCLEYERSRAKIAEMRERVRKKLKLKNLKTEAAAKREETIIMWWIEIDAKDRPEAYGIEYGDLDDEAAVRVVTGAA